MNMEAIAVVVISTFVLIILILALLWVRRVKCRNCEYFREGYKTALDGQGLYRFGYCEWEVHDCKEVEPDIERKCENFRKKKNGKLPGDIT